MMTRSCGSSNTFNSPEDCVDKATNSQPVSVTPSPRKKQKKFVDTTKKQSSGNSMYGVLCKRGFALLFCENGNDLSAKNYTNPGSCKKAWTFQFEKGEFKY